MLLSSILAGENGGTSLPSLAARKQRARLVQAVADKFVAAFVTAAGLQAHVTVYMHVIKCHLRQFVELYGNLMDYSAQGSEHCHVLTKYAFKHHTNKRTDQRVEQALRAVAMLQYYERLFPVRKEQGQRGSHLQMLRPRMKQGMRWSSRYWTLHNKIGKNLLMLVAHQLR